MMSLGRSDRRAALSGGNPLFEEDLFSVRRRCQRAAHKGGHAVLLSVALKCLRDLGKVSMECSIVDAEDNVCINGNKAAFNSHSLAYCEWDMFR